MSTGVASGRRAVFPLVPRRRLVGAPFGNERSRRRGHGTDVAGRRDYVRGDAVASIDWHASARLASARGSDEFVVRTYFAHEAPRVTLVCDHRPSMSLYAPPLPWLSKPAALAAATRAIAASAAAARAEFAYLDFADSAPYWLHPTARSAGRLLVSGRIDDAAFAAPPDLVERAFDFLARRARDVPAGAFVFVLSDFLEPSAVRALERALSEQWDVVPVVIQDPVWEQTFPDVAGAAVSVCDPETGRAVPVRFRRRDVRERRAANEERLRDLLARCARLGLDPVVLGTSDRRDVLQAFIGWAERRGRARVARR